MRETERETAALPVVDTPSLDLVFDLLADQRRRYALYYLYDVSDGVATIDEIATYVLDLEVEDTHEHTEEHDESESDEQHQQIVTALQHMHLPKLEDAGVLEHDPRSQAVRYWNQPSLEEWLEHAKHKELS